MDNDTTLPIGYYIELANEYGNYKGRIVAHDDKWIVIDPLPSTRRSSEELPNKRWWLPASRTYLITVAPSPPQPQNQGREGEAEPAREAGAPQRVNFDNAFLTTVSNYLYGGARAR